MRILMLTQVIVYPADAGPKIKTLQVLRHLALDYEIIYCTFIRNLKEQEDAKQLAKLCSRILTIPIKRSRIGDLRFLLESLISGDSFLLRRDSRLTMHSTVCQLLREEHIDVIHVDQLNMMRFVPPDWSGAVILDEHNAVWQVVERLRRGTRNRLANWFLRREVNLLRKLEGDACRHAHMVLTVSEQDKRALQEVAGESIPIEVVPITIDAQSLEAIWLARKPRSNCLLTIGTLFWPPNSEGIIWWLRQGYEKLQALHPDLTYDIVGARPPRKLQRLVRRYQGVNLHGYVAETESFWTKATILVVPLLSGGGVRVKILEAMAMGVPVISTTVGCEGLAVRNGEHLLIADTPEAFNNACMTLLQDQKLARHLTENARQLILEHYDAKVALQSLDKIYKRVIKERELR